MNLVIVPILLPLLTAVMALAWGRPTAARRGLVALSAAAQLAVALMLGGRVWDGGALVLPLGNWSAALGIVLVVDVLSAVLLALAAFTMLAGIVYGYAELPVRWEHPLRLPLVQFLAAGINLAFCTGDLFNLFVAFEVMLIASYALLTLEADDWDVKQAFPYVAINLVGSTLFLAGAGMTYALFGTLNFAELAARAPALVGDARLGALALLLLLVFGIKAGLFPLFYWLPHSYPTLPTPLAAIYGGILTKLGVYVVLRVFGLVFPAQFAGYSAAFGWLAAATAVLGGIGAISRAYIRGILSFHIISQVGLMLLAASFGNVAGFTAALLILGHNIVVKGTLFLLGGVGACLNRTDDLERMGNLWKHVPWVGVLFILQALSLAGIPPLSGFWGKYVLFTAALEADRTGLVVAAAFAGLLTLFSMLKIWLAAFWTPRADTAVRMDDSRWPRMTAVAAAMTLASLIIGLGAEGTVRVARRAAADALDQNGYIEAVRAVTTKDRANR
jgi:multicomponent Na+:H+ antiporter subunit D